MPNIIIALSDIESSVERPVIYDIIRQVMDITQISHKTPIRFYGDEGKSAQKHSTISKEGISENRWGYDDKINIEVDEDFEKDRILSTAIKQPENQIIFRDQELRVSIKPIYSSSDVTVSFKYRARDKNQASRWRNEMRARASMMRDINLHEIVYSYGLPEAFIVLLQEIHSLRENVGGYAEGFDEYFSKRLTTNASIISNLSGKQAMWAISERQIRIQGYFEFEAVPDKPEKDGDHDAWTSSFNYRFKYDKPIHCNMMYPIIVHQQLLSTQFRPEEKAYSITDQLKSYTLSAKLFSKFESDRGLLEVESNKGVDIPGFDEFIPSSIVPATVRVFTALSQITEEDKVSLFNLADLGDFSLDGDILEFMVEVEYPYLGRTFHSIFCLNLYENEYLKASGSLVVNSSLNVKAINELTLRKTHRVRLSLFADFSYLRSEALNRLKSYPKAAIKIANAINAALSDCGNQTDIKKNRLDEGELNAIGLTYAGADGNMTNIVAINDYRNGPNSGDTFPLGTSKFYNPQGRQANLVQSLFVATRYKHEYESDKNNQNYNLTT